MSGKTVNSAIFLLVIGNALALVSDVMIKLLEADAPIFQFVFLRSLITLVVLLPFYRHIDRKHLFAGASLHFSRAHLHLIGMLCMVYALLNLPLATANAVFYAAPIIVMLLSVVFFKERLTGLSLLAVFSGFAGILVILRPVDFSWAALAALATALTLAINAVLVRRLPAQQSTVHKLVLNYLMILPLCAALMLWEGAQWSWGVLFSALGSAIFILGYNISVLLAYRQVDANQITSAEYTGLLWAVAIGWIWFAEVPDLWFLSGSLMIVLPLILIGLQHRKRVRIANHHLSDTRYHPVRKQSASS
ncbi:DMT family transporter [Halopseudomonas salegens]|uniref:EamA-like transporter family protein n=1 Tax=Halopseudomonas salegens TaxID=1434072 RepID=A0A1H2ECL9_9GAMM|nr:DMT family transporter [Halopseudomonas salegens]SDT92764.1 EamA-like transporter family protein [Halopseudomonas salegens]